MNKVWTCKIGWAAEDDLPYGSDAPMREAIEEAFFALTGKRPDFTFSGWGGELTEDELGVGEDRQPKYCDQMEEGGGTDGER